MNKWLCLAVLTGCINHDTTLFEVRFTGNVLAPDGNTSTVYLEAHHLLRDQGAFDAPLGLVESWSLDAPGAVDHTWLHPVDDAEGLVLFAWQDRDEDGVLCTPEVREDPVALAAFEVLEHELTADLVLTETCLGPERLLP